LIAKGTEHAESDIDLMLVGDPAGVLSYGSMMALLEPVEKQLGRSINPTIYSCEEFAKRIESNQSFVTRVMDQPKLWIKGGANGE
ncbi:MAG: nucleotidyltransferase domain-containing protein, partial [Sedimenticola sp.]|nr:nucleotidyltransferase domain-containing protein [Sedimenticola sp.]